MRHFIKPLICSFVVFLCLVFSLNGQDDFEGKKIALPVDVVFEEKDTNEIAKEQFRSIIESVVGDKYSRVKIRESIAQLYETDKIVWVKVDAIPNVNGTISLRYTIRSKLEAKEIIIRIADFTGEKLTEDELFLRANFLSAGSAITEQILRRNADAIQSYLRDLGFYNANVTWKLIPEEDRSTKVVVEFFVKPNEQARVDRFDININGFDATAIRRRLALRPGEFFSTRKLDEDLQKIKTAILRSGRLAPFLEEPKVSFDPERNKISIELKGNLGPTVKIRVEAGDEKVGEDTQSRLLPVKREGRIDQSAIVEGARRLRNYFQQKGYFFAKVRPICAVSPSLPPNAINQLKNDTELLCSFLSGIDLEGRQVEIKYIVNLNRRLKLKEVRIEGSDKLTTEELKPILETQVASFLGIVPALAYGRGYTNSEMLESDRQQIEAIMRELGYRKAKVSVKQGVSLDSNNLIITFVVEEGPITRITETEILGNTAFSSDQLEAIVSELRGKAFSNALIKNVLQKLIIFYEERGYFDVKIAFRTLELQSNETENEERLKVIFEISKEGKPTLTNRIFINGNERTDTSTILRVLELKPGKLLRSSDVLRTEQTLYETGAFRRIETKIEPAGETSDGKTRKDVIINVEEEKPRDLQYGGGYSTDSGAFGVVNLRYNNLFGRLQQINVLGRVSALQQLFQVDFLEPHFLREERAFSPLRLTAQYQRDTTVTRFFRSAFDKGTFGIVQRLDQNGNPIDVFGNVVKNPAIERFGFTLETQKNIHPKTKSILFLRYRYEKVDLLNIESLLIRDLLSPDSKIRISGFGSSFIFDTRRNCSKKQALLELIQKGEILNPCRYNPTETTDGHFLSANYDISIPTLGANTGFQKVQVTYQNYYTLRSLNTTLATRFILGAGQVFFERANRFPASLSALSGILPISERFFAGGSTTLRGFEFESAGPRIVSIPTGIFRTSNGTPIFLPPFTTPLGGNALAIFNTELRIKLTSSLQTVPFYDGGNVFSRFKDIFKPPTVNPNDVLGSNLRATWTNTVGLGFRIKTPLGGSIAVDFGYLLNPPRFLIPQTNMTNAIYQLRQTQIHFRISQAF